MATQNRNNNNPSKDIYFKTIQKLQLKCLRGICQIKNWHQKETNKRKGTMYNLLPKNMFKKLNRVPLKKTAMLLFSFGGATVKQEGICQLRVRFQDRFVGTTFHIINSEEPLLLGLQTSLELGLVTLNLIKWTLLPQGNTKPRQIMMKK